MMLHKLILIPLLICFGLASVAQAVGPDTDGDIPGSNNGEGIGVLVSRTTGVWNTGTGREALNHLTSGNQNTATGLRALFSDTSGGYNTATGIYALFSNTSGFFNSATGAYSLAQNTSGSNNTANGFQALYNNTTAQANVANGFQALYNNTTGGGNTATGYRALLHNTGGGGNTATGWAALAENTGSANTAIGSQALLGDTTGEQNTAIGFGALIYNTTGSFNTAVGLEAGDAVTTANNVICIGWNVIGANVDNSCFIGNIRGVATANADAIPVLIDSAGQLGTISSSRRFKKEIKPMEQASAAILALKPVTFHYKSDNSGTPQFGLIAEEVAEINPDLVVRDDNGEVYTVRYDAVNTMLLNEFLKEHGKVEKLEAAVAQQRKDFEATTAQQQTEIRALTASLIEQAAQIQKVSAQLEMTKPASRTVVDNR